MHSRLVKVIYVDENGKELQNKGKLIWVPSDSMIVDAENVGAPKGYELISTGPVAIKNNWMWLDTVTIKVSKIETTYTVRVVMKDEKGTITELKTLKLTEGTYTLKELKDLGIKIPEGYTVVDEDATYTVDTEIANQFVIDVKLPTYTVDVMMKDEKGTVTNLGQLKLNESTYTLKELEDLGIEIPEGYTVVDEDATYTVDTEIANQFVIDVKLPTYTVDVMMKDEYGTITQLGKLDLIEGSYTLEELEENGIEIPEGYIVVDQESKYTIDSEMANQFVINVKHEEQAPETGKATLLVTLKDAETLEVVGDVQTIESEEGVLGETYTFVGGEYEVKIPEGYELVGEYPTLDVKYGQSLEVTLGVSKIAEEPTEPGDEEDTNKPSEEGKTEESNKESEKTDGTKTGVAMSLAGVFGTMSVALAGIVALLRRKQK